MKEKYILRIKSGGGLIARNIILAICLVAILALIACSVAALGNGSYIDLLWYAIAFAVVVAVQLMTTFLMYELIIEYDQGNITIKKRYYKKLRTLLECNCHDIKISNYAETDRDKKSIHLVIKSCALPIYMIELSGTTYILNLDDYMYSLIEVNGK